MQQVTELAFYEHITWVSQKAEVCVLGDNVSQKQEVPFMLDMSE